MLFLQILNGLSALIGIQVQRQEPLDDPTACICDNTGASRKNMTFIMEEIVRANTFRPDPQADLRYPHLYRGTDNITFHYPDNPACNLAGADWVEFPLTSPPYNTTTQPMNAGAARVVYLLNSDLTFCGCIQHPPGSSTRFVQCRYVFD